MTGRHRTDRVKICARAGGYMETTTTATNLPSKPVNFEEKATFFKIIGPLPVFKITADHPVNLV